MQKTFKYGMIIPYKKGFKRMVFLPFVFFVERNGCMIDFQIKDALNSIIEKTYGDVRPFSIELVYRPAKITDNYDSASGNIKLYNLGRSSSFILLGALFQMAKHVSLSNYGTYTDGSEEYFKICHTLISEALRQGYISQSNIDYPDKRVDKLIAVCGDFENVEVNSDVDPRYLVQVKNCYKIKDLLREAGFRWNKDAATWEKVSSDFNEATDLENIILELDSSVIIVKSKITDLRLELYAYICVLGKGTYAVKDALKERGYVYKGYNRNGWVKKLLFAEVADEREFLASVEGIHYNVKN